MDDSAVPSSNKFEIPVEGLFSGFSEHINASSNKRIFFSGQFGIGKTFFLNKFFGANKSTYEAFHLFPVNYQISSNEDIIDLLKYDLLVELTKRDKDLFKKNKLDGAWDLMTLFYIWCKTNFSMSKAAGMAVNSASAIAAFYNPALAPLSKLGKPVEDSVNLLEKFQEFREDFEAGEQGFIKKYLDSSKTRRILETDYLSELLKEKVAQSAHGRESVLILDDLDRIDPEHIFRILNVFSAHLNLNTNDEYPNKFGFDKIILVGDRDNIEHIFAHRYGIATNFSGYFDKFYSIETYRFSNETVVSEYIEQLVKAMKPDGKLGAAFEEHGYALILLSDVLREWLVLSTKEKLNMRKVLKLHHAHSYLTAKYAGLYRGDPFDNRDIHMLQFIDFCINFLASVADGIEDLIKTFVAIKNTPVLTEQRNRSWLFNQYLAAVVTSHDFSKESALTWNGYSLKADFENPFGGVQIIEAKQDQNQKTLFYDLLYHYIRSGKHKIPKSRW